MNEIGFITHTIPCCQKNDTVQTECSIISRATAIVLGLIALTVAALIFLKVEGLNHLGTNPVWISMGTGIGLIAMGLLLQYVKVKKTSTSPASQEMPKENSTTRSFLIPAAIRQQLLKKEFTPVENLKIDRNLEDNVDEEFDPIHCIQMNKKLYVLKVRIHGVGAFKGCVRCYDLTLPTKTIFREQEMKVRPFRSSSEQHVNFSTTPSTSALNVGIRSKTKKDRIYVSALAYLPKKPVNMVLSENNKLYVLLEGNEVFIYDVTDGFIPIRPQKTFLNA